MSDESVEQALSICEEHANGYYAGPRGDLIPAAEAALGFSLPPSYRQFIERLGAGSIGSFEVYGLTKQPFTGVVPDAVGRTLHDRNGPSRLPHTMLIIGSDGMGGDYVLDVSKGAEPPVEVWEGGRSVPGQQLERVSDSFGSWLLENVRIQART